MDCNKVGLLIASLRKEKSLTQREIAERMNISDRTVSKWERGLGCPDVSLLRELSEILEVNIERILLGELSPNSIDGGNMKKIKFYFCPNCGNILTSGSDAEVSCCGRKLAAMVPKPAAGKHSLTVETIEDDFYITFPHEMTKEHYLNFVAYVAGDRILLVHLYPEQASEVRFPKLYGGKLYFGCNKHGLYYSDEK